MLPVSVAHGSDADTPPAPSVVLRTRPPLSRRIDYQNYFMTDPMQTGFPRKHWFCMDLDPPFIPLWDEWRIIQGVAMNASYDWAQSQGRDIDRTGYVLAVIDKLYEVWWWTRCRSGLVPLPTAADYRREFDKLAHDVVQMAEAACADARVAAPTLDEADWALIAAAADRYCTSKDAYKPLHPTDYRPFSWDRITSYRQPDPVYTYDIQPEYSYQAMAPELADIIFQYRDSKAKAAEAPGKRGARARAAKARTSDATDDSDKSGPTDSGASGPQIAAMSTTLEVTASSTGSAATLASCTSRARALTKIRESDGEVEQEL
ncbi:hypothetical protein CC85DRAFT_313238 [Cutaneotrichosporon oleaginosum]|uniref:Uncharacterized protein n=1 Tax=Cutaneotrichosporon oleaginosum TaxID=879819 RepID=A0A0J0XHM7_9TREE|nr:uncharacterized protein CC85DRAFT_313238 [Cutaneotrichosporon oleaginosum]KLT40611.1 hypothetical protein CC85DRAFT_313238 [Cutaneotrichosporon oleaginosum]TXT03933.1 hypothetical protein COLE_07630 [Cutaneotrichosporon oleaginosum]